MLGSCTSDECRVEDETVLVVSVRCSMSGVARCMYLGGVSLGLEGSEKCFLGTENLDSGSGVFGQVGQRSTDGQH